MIFFIVRSPFSSSDDKPIDFAFVQYQESLLDYQKWSNKDCRACFTMLYCMHDGPIGEFEGCPTTKDMWDKLKIRFGQTSTTRFVPCTSSGCSMRLTPLVLWLNTYEP